MALTISDRGTGTHGSAASSVTPGGRTATIAAGSMGVLCINIDNAGGSGDTVTLPASATDSVGNVWTRRINQVGDFGVASTGFEYAFYTSFITTAFLTTDTLTLTYSPVVSPVVKVWTWYEVSSGLGMNISYSTGGQIAAATAANASVTTGTIPVGDVVIGMYAGEHAAAVTGDSDTTNGTWTTQQTAQTGATTSGQRIASQGKVQTTTPSTQTYNVTVASADRGAGYIVLHENYAQPEAATGTGAALDATIEFSDGGAPKSVNAGLATGVGLASESGMAHSEAALGSGAANNASAHVKATAQFDQAGSVPTVVNWGAFTSGAGAPSVAHPASLAAGDLLVFFVTVRNTGLLSANTGAGWAEHPDSPVWNGSTSGTLGAAVHVFYKIATGSESGSLGGWGTASEYVGRMGAFRGVNQSDPFNVTASNSTTGTTSPATLPTAATTVANCLVIIALGLGTATAPAPGAMSNSILTSQTNVGSQNTTSDQDAYLNLQHGINASAGLWGATTISKNTNSGYAIIGISVQSGTSGGGTGRAYDAVGFESGGGTSPNAEVAAATGLANNARPHVKPGAETASGTGQALDARFTHAAAEAATASGEAYDATVEGAGKEVDAELVATTGEAYNATASTVEYREGNAEVATGTGAALGAIPHVQPTARFTGDSGPMPTIVGLSGSYTNNAGTMTMPAGIQAGDISFLFSATRAFSVGVPSGYTALYTDAHSNASDPYAATSYRVLDGTETEIPNWNTGTSRIHRAIVIRGLPSNPASFLEGAAVSEGNVNPVGHPAVTTTGPNRLVIAFTSHLDDGNQTPFAGTTGGTWSEQSDVGNGSGSDGQHTIHSAQMASAGTISGGTGNNALSNRWITRAFALVPNGPSGIAYDAAGIEAGGATSANAEVATGTGTINNPRLHVRPRSEVSAATATASTPSIGIYANAGVATGAGEAISAFSAAPETATGSGAASDATARVLVSGGLASASGAAYVPIFHLGGAAGAGLASGTWTVPAPRGHVKPRAGIATASASSLAAIGYTGVVYAQAGLATAIGTAYNSAHSRAHAGLAVGYINTKDALIPGGSSGVGGGPGAGVGGGADLGGAAPVSTVVIRYDDVDITDDVIFSTATFTASVRGSPGTCSIRVRDDGHTYEFVPGKSLTLTINNRREWTGFLASVKQGYWFVGTYDDPEDTSRYFELAGVDLNILLQKRVMFDPAQPTNGYLKEFPPGTSDKTVISYYVSHYLDLSSDDLDISTMVQAVGTPETDSAISGSAGWTWDNFMRSMTRDTGAIYYINPDREFVVADDETVSAPFVLTDAPEGVSNTIDDFARTVPLGWGIGLLGQWQGSSHTGSLTEPSMPDPSFYVRSGRGVAEDNADEWEGINLPLQLPMDIVGEFSYDRRSVGQGSQAKLLICGAGDDPRTEYIYHLQFVSVGATGHLNVLIGSENLAVSGGGIFAGLSLYENVPVHFRWQIYDTGYRVKVWLDTEPAGWNLTRTQSESRTPTMLAVVPTSGATHSGTWSFNHILFMEGLGTSGQVGYRELEIHYGGEQLRNDVLGWGIGQGSAQPVFVRTQDQASIASHGRWQLGLMAQTVWRQKTLNRIVNSYVYGSPQNKRGGKDDQLSVKCTIFQPGMRAGMKATVISEVFGLLEVLPVRSMVITFPTPYSPRYDLTLSHEIDDPWTTIEFWSPRIIPPTYPSPHPIDVDGPGDIIIDGPVIGDPIVPVITGPGGGGYDPCGAGGVGRMSYRDAEAPDPAGNYDPTQGLNIHGVESVAEGQAEFFYENMTEDETSPVYSSTPGIVLYFAPAYHHDWDAWGVLATHWDDDDGGTWVDWSWANQGPYQWPDATGDYGFSLPETYEESQLPHTLKWQFGDFGGRVKYWLSSNAEPVDWGFEWTWAWSPNPDLYRYLYFEFQEFHWAENPAYPLQPIFALQYLELNGIRDDFAGYVLAEETGGNWGTGNLGTWMNPQQMWQDSDSELYPDDSVYSVGDGSIAPGLIDDFDREIPVGSEEAWGTGNLGTWDSSDNAGVVDSHGLLYGDNFPLATSAGAQLTFNSPISLPIHVRWAFRFENWIDVPGYSDIDFSVHSEGFDGAVYSGLTILQVGGGGGDVGIGVISTDGDLENDDSDTVGTDWFQDSETTMFAELYDDGITTRAKAYREGDPTPGWQVECDSLLVTPIEESVLSTIHVTEAYTLILLMDSVSAMNDPCGSAGPGEFADPPQYGSHQEEPTPIATPPGGDPTWTYFTTTHQWQAGTLRVYVEGEFQRPGIDWSGVHTDRTFWIFEDEVDVTADEITVDYDIYQPTAAPDLI